MASLSEMVQLAQAQQRPNGLADIATHFLEGASTGYDAGHAEALKNQENPMVDDPLTPGRKVRLNTISKLLDVQSKMASIEEAKNINALITGQTMDKEMTNRDKTLGTMAVNALQADGTAGPDGKIDNTGQGKITNLVTNPGRKRSGKLTVGIKDGKPTVSMDFADSKNSTVEQMTAMKDYVEKGDPAPLATAFPEGIPEWATKFMAQHAEIKQKQKAIDDEKSKVYNQKRLTSLGDALDPSKQRQGAFGVSKQVFDRAERLQTLASAFTNGNQLRDSEIEELAIGLNAMLSGSNTGAQEQVKGLIPKTAIGSAQKLRQWLTNEPQGTHQGEFVKRMLGSVDREKATAADQIKRTQFSRATRYADLEKSNPDEFYNQLQANGIEPEEYQAWKNNGFKPISAVQKPDGEATDAKTFSPDVISYAQKHSITPAQALQVKIARTGGR